MKPNSSFHGTVGLIVLFVAVSVSATLLAFDGDENASCVPAVAGAVLCLIFFGAIGWESPTGKAAVMLMAVAAAVSLLWFMYGGPM